MKGFAGGCSDHSWLHRACFACKMLWRWCQSENSWFGCNRARLEAFASYSLFICLSTQPPIYSYFQSILSCLSTFLSIHLSILLTYPIWSIYPSILLLTYPIWSIHLTLYHLTLYPSIHLSYLSLWYWLIYLYLSIYPIYLYCIYLIYQSVNGTFSPSIHLSISSCMGLQCLSNKLSKEYVDQPVFCTVCKSNYS